MKNLDTIGTQIRQLREENEMPLRKLAALLDIDQSTLSKIERDERKPNAQIIEQIAKIFMKDKEMLLVAFYSDIVAYEIQEENLFSEILQVAEAKIQYQRNKKMK
ncbi:helix-turn-helix domain-containing protein [Emticicia sp. SJ17W-69]|uniref:helix-turn-helix domain-containing protein n=1 Tax=Emticicia sp. SJ17W-69 TaxID=3421657 RepID=UPI003EBF66D5